MATSVNDAMAGSMCMCTGEPTDDQLQKIRTRKPEAPVIEVDMKDGSKKKLWCTFGAQQIDIDPFSKPGTPALPCTASLTLPHSALLCGCHVCKVRSVECRFDMCQFWY